MAECYHRQSATIMDSAFSRLNLFEQRLLDVINRYASNEREQATDLPYEEELERLRAADDPDIITEAA